MGSAKVVDKDVIEQELFKTLEMARRAANQGRPYEGFINVAAVWLELYDRLEGTKRKGFGYRKDDEDD